MTSTERGKVDDNTLDLPQFRENISTLKRNARMNKTIISTSLTKPDSIDSHGRVKVSCYVDIVLYFIYLIFEVYPF